ncbi:MAG: DUF1003 domain-containing protein, partial [Alphaproteobacteria bacterium]|nr:DUF1003 domain-containing protein [Alphaproteobacteria bacterium]
MSDVAILLSAVPTFRALAPDRLAALAAALRPVAVSKGDIVFRIGDPGDHLYLVRTGEVGISFRDHLGQRIELDRCGPGRMFGELALLNERPRSATAEVTADCELLTLDREAFLRVVRENPDVAIDLLAGVTALVRVSDERLRGATARNANEETEVRHGLRDRIANTIAYFAGSLTFLFLHAALFAVWIGLNLGGLFGHPFDPFPFGLLMMAVSLESIFLTVFILLSQNLQTARDRVRNDIEYDVNIKAEQQIGHLHEKLDRLHEDVV